VLPDNEKTRTSVSSGFGRLGLGKLGRRVFLVAVASLVPVALLSFVLLITNAREQRDRLLGVSEDTMLALMSATDTELKSTIAALDALAASPRLGRGDFERLREEALELLGRRSSWLNVVVLDADRQYMNARVAEDEPLPEVTSRDIVGEAMRTKAPVVGQVVYSPVIKTSAVTVLVPYVRNGEVQYVIVAALRPDSFLKLLDLQNVAGEGVIGIFDRNYNVVARSLNQAESVGKPASPTLIKMLESGADRGSATTRTLEGVPVYTVFRRSEFSGWVSAVGIPMRSVDGPVTRSYLLFGGAVVLSILLGLLVATLVGRTIVGPMHELEESATRVGRGEAPSIPDTRLEEVRRVAVALAKAHDERTASFQREHEARLTAEHASKAKDEFLAMLGHELRNPLAAITNASQVIDRQRGTLEPTVATATGIITRQSRHLARMTDDLLDAGRVILGKISLTRAPLDLAVAVASALDGLRNTGRVGDHVIDVTLDPVWVFADATRIDQIVGNLLTNALKYTPAGGRISVRTRRENAQAVFEVADTGIGLEAELLPRAFELFVQGERGLDRSQGGLGIGLTLVRRLAELHGGTAAAASAGSGQGATFTVRLPAVEAPADCTPANNDTGLRSRHHVAIVEDNDDARISLRMVLEFEGHEVHEAPDGNTGVPMIAGNASISVAFVDIGLPGMSGYDIARAVRQLRGSTVRLVAMSGYGADADVAKGVEAGFDAYIVKPADISALRPEIAKA
jgi:signal transduction histidine kinase/CheY-like chemotaxis protein